MSVESHSDDNESAATAGGPPQGEHRQTIRSFVRREGRLTRAQDRALTTLWPRYGLSMEDRPLDPVATFGRVAPLCMEIGFGNGEALLEMATAHPDHDFIGVEVYRPGIGGLLLKLEEAGAENVRVFRDDAKPVLAQSIPDEALDALFLFFPDPWPKKRHHKRRLIQPGFVRLAGQKLKSGGIFHMATDWQNYAEHMLEVMEARSDFENTAGPGAYAREHRWRPQTRFERRGRKLGHEVWDLIYRRTT